VTGARNGVVVTSGQDTPVSWLNRQAAPQPGDGTITITKTIESSSGGTPDNPASPSRAGFTFDVLTAGTTTVVDTVTTSSGGTVTTIGLAPGSYDVRERDPAPLTDVTSARNGVVVTSGQDTPVSWLNRQAPPTPPPPPVPASTLTLSKQFIGFDDADQSSTITVGDTLKYTLTVTNVVVAAGGVTLTNVTIVDPLTGTSTNVGSLAPGASKVVQATYVVQASDVGSSVVNTAVADSDQTGPDDDSVTVPIPDAPPEVPESALTLTKLFTGFVDADGSGTITVGDTLEYDLTVTNVVIAFGGETLHNVTIVDPLTGTNINIGSLAPGESRTVQVTYVVQATDAGTTVVNTAVGDSDETLPDDDSETVDVPEGEVVPIADEPIAVPAIDIELLTNGIDADTPGTAVEVESGSVVVWTYVVTNTGEVTLTNVTVVDDNGTPNDASDDITIASGVTLPAGESLRGTSAVAAEIRGAAVGASAQYERSGVAITGLFGKHATATAAEGVSDLDPSFYVSSDAGDLLPVADEPITGPPAPIPPVALPNTGSGGLADGTGSAGGTLPSALWLVVGLLLTGISALVARRAGVVPRRWRVR
jgi:uncharacterized repeat protein (TIGR01451 family)